MCSAEREAFSVPFYCIGSNASFEMPTQVHFVQCPVKEVQEKIFCLCSKSGIAVEFKVQTFGPFTVYPLKGILLPDKPFQFLVKFTPQSVGILSGGAYFEIENSNFILSDMIV